MSDSKVWGGAGFPDPGTRSYMRPHRRPTCVSCLPVGLARRSCPTPLWGRPLALKMACSLAFKSQDSRAHLPILTDPLPLPAPQVRGLPLRLRLGGPGEGPAVPASGGIGVQATEGPLRQARRRHEDRHGAGQGGGGSAAVGGEVDPEAEAWWWGWGGWVWRGRFKWEVEVVGRTWRGRIADAWSPLLWMESGRSACQDRSECAPDLLIPEPRLCVSLMRRAGGGGASGVGGGQAGR